MLKWISIDTDLESCPFVEEVDYTLVDWTLLLNFRNCKDKKKITYLDCKKMCKWLLIVARFLGKVTSSSLFSLGKTDHILGSAVDGIELSEENITQEPFAVTSSVEASKAAIVLSLWERLWRRNSDVRKVLWWEKIQTLAGKTNTNLPDEGRGWEGKFLSLDVEGHIWHLRNIVTADSVLRADGEKKEYQSIEVWFYCWVFQLC